MPPTHAPPSNGYRGGPGNNAGFPVQGQAESHGTGLQPPPFTRYESPPRPGEFAGNASRRVRSGHRIGASAPARLQIMSSTMPRGQRLEMEGPTLEIVGVQADIQEAYCLPLRNRNDYAATLASMTMGFEPATFFIPVPCASVFDSALRVSVQAAKRRSFGITYMMVTIDLLTGGGFSTMVGRTLGAGAMTVMDTNGFQDWLHGIDMPGASFPVLAQPQHGVDEEAMDVFFATLSLLLQMSARNPLSLKIKEQVEARSKAITELTGAIPMTTALPASAPFRTMINTAFNTIARTFGVELLTSLKATSVARLGILSKLALETLDIFYGVAAPGLRGIINLICMGCPMLLTLPSVQDELPALVQMLKDVRSSVRANPICSGDSNWYFFLKASGGKSFTTFTRETKKLHVIVGGILNDLGVDTVQMWGGFVDHQGTVAADIVDDAVELYRTHAHCRYATGELTALLGDVWTTDEE